MKNRGKGERENDRDRESPVEPVKEESGEKRSHLCLETAPIAMPLPHPQTLMRYLAIETLSLNNGRE